MTRRATILLRSAVLSTGLVLLLMAPSAAGTGGEVGRRQARGDLAAADWCYYQINNGLTIYPIVKNVGPGPWASNREGTYVIGVTAAWVQTKRTKRSRAIHTEERYTLPKAPYFELASGSSSRLNGVKAALTFSPEGVEYGLQNLWHIAHPEDPNMANNENLGVSGWFKGKEFRPGGKLFSKRCKTPWD